MSTVPIERQIAAVKREISMRRHVYPKWVAGGKLTQAAAEQQIADMEAVQATLERVLREERPSLPGFDSLV
jgi:hypothetical protein